MSPNDNSGEAGPRHHSSPASAAPGPAPSDPETDPTTGVERRPPVVYRPVLAPYSPRSQQRVMRRTQRTRSLPPWLGRVSWFLFLLYGIMRRNDPDYVERAARWREREFGNGEGRSL